ncbi:Zn(2)-C6 fungal-type domain-containing protein [Fusarium sp. Ph1]|nr:Zn(2)-C6 fungal-type domain-containing protein [Fusarium sp. Ph1]
MSSPLHMDKPRACSNCSRAKAKCVWPATDDEDGEPETCQSLVCSRSHSVSKRKRGKATQSKVIEQKLDNIMALLSRERNRPIEPPSSLPSNAFTPAAIQASHQDISSAPSLHSPASYPQQDAFISIVPGFQISFAEAGQVLQEYMTEMLPQFPFVPLPSIDAYDLYKRKPLLIKTILWVCRPPGPETYAAFEDWFRQHVAYQTVVLMNKSLEIVQALLVFFAWNDIFFYANSKDTSLLQLAIGLLADLGLHKRPSTTHPAFGSIVDDAADLRNDLQPQPGHSSDDRRAALGVYYVASIRCSILGKLSGLEYTPRLDEYTRQLLQDQEYPTDLLLVNLVQIRQIAIKVNDAFGNTGDTLGDKTSGSVRAIVVASIRNELDTFTNSLPEHLQSNHLLRSHCAAVRIRLLEPVNHGNRHDPLEPTHLRCRAMWDCLESTQALIDAFLLIPIESYPSLTFVPILHLALAIIKAFRLLCVEDQAWDLHTAQTMYNLPDILQRLSKLFEEASRIGRPRCSIMANGRPLFCEYAESYKGIEYWYMSKVGVAHSDLMDSVVAHDGDQYKGFDFWNQLSDLTYGLGP